MQTIFCSLVTSRSSPPLSTLSPLPIKSSFQSLPPQITLPLSPSPFLNAISQLRAILYIPFPKPTIFPSLQTPKAPPVNFNTIKSLQRSLRIQNGIIRVFSLLLLPITDISKPDTYPISSFLRDAQVLCPYTKYLKHYPHHSY